MMGAGVDGVWMRAWRAMDCAVGLLAGLMRASAGVCLLLGRPGVVSRGRCLGTDGTLRELDKLRKSGRPKRAGSGEREIGSAVFPRSF
ncbi:hypothetical protein F5Y03DRAFT_200109 [Xylaria venustula]|nr:hypothetical protein F5Y03DRAFT_200109 [Xylaria venustula]